MKKSDCYAYSNGMGCRLENFGQKCLCEHLPQGEDPENLSFSELKSQLQDLRGELSIYRQTSQRRIAEKDSEIEALKANRTSYIEGLISEIESERQKYKELETQLEEFRGLYETYKHQRRVIQILRLGLEWIASTGGNAHWAHQEKASQTLAEADKVGK